VTPGNPLASVLRATRDHLVRLNPKAGESRDLSPYPLLLVRPDGLLVYDRARMAIEAGDFDLGFELVESDWKLKFPQADPQLANIEAQALDQAKARQQILAAAAPRAYGNSSMASSGEFDDDGYGDGGSGSGGGGSGFGGGGGGGNGGGGGSREYLVSKSRHDGDDEYGADQGEVGSGGSAASRGSGKSAGAGSSSSTVGGPGGNSPQGGESHGSGDVAGNSSGPSMGGAGDGAPSGVANGSGSEGGAGGSVSSGGNGQPPSVKATDKSLTPDGYQNEQGASVMAGSPAPRDSNDPHAASDPRSEKERVMAAENHGKDWALKQKPPRSIPVRRTIHVSVGKDQIAILPDSGPATAAGKVIRMHGDTVESVDEFVKQVRDHIDGWGIAGNNLYWRPVVVLSVGPGGQQRANDLSRLLKNSGLEIRADETAKNLPQGSAHETR
jgi:hypothetical protein